MLYRLGRVLQVLGMVILPIGVAGNVVKGNDVFPVQYSLVWAAIGVAVFAAGWLLQQFGRAQ
jgi:hypothetical protein